MIYLLLYKKWEKENGWMVDKEFGLNDIVEMKKQHPCGENRWEVIRMGMDIRIKCLGCNHRVLLPRREFVKKMKRVIEHAKNT